MVEGVDECDTGSEGGMIERGEEEAWVDGNMRGERGGLSEG